MPAGRYSFTLEQGATFTRTITWRDSAGALVNLTGYSARMMVKDAAGATILDLVDTGATGTQINALTLGGAAGTIVISLTAAQTAALAPTAPDALLYDLELIDGATVTRLLQGRTWVSAEVTV